MAFRQPRIQGNMGGDHADGCVAEITVLVSAHQSVYVRAWTELADMKWNLSASRRRLQHKYLNSRSPP